VIAADISLSPSPNGTVLCQREGSSRLPALRQQPHPRGHRPPGTGSRGPDPPPALPTGPLRSSFVADDCTSPYIGHLLHARSGRFGSRSCWSPTSTMPLLVALSRVDDGQDGSLAFCYRQTHLCTHDGSECGKCGPREAPYRRPAGKVCSVTFSFATTLQSIFPWPLRMSGWRGPTPPSGGNVCPFWAALHGNHLPRQCNLGGLRRGGALTRTPWGVLACHGPPTKLFSTVGRKECRHGRRQKAARATRNWIERETSDDRMPCRCGGTLPPFLSCGQPSAQQTPVLCALCAFLAVYGGLPARPFLRPPSPPPFPPHFPPYPSPRWGNVAFATTWRRPMAAAIRRAPALCGKRCVAGACRSTTPSTRRASVAMPSASTYSCAACAV